MAGINHLIDNVIKLDPLEVVKQALVQTEPALITTQQEQMLHGLNANGGKIGKYKSKKYAAMKFNLNSLAGLGNVDLKLKNEFQRNIKVYFFSTSFFFKSTDVKTPNLVKRYGEDIFGLNTKYTRQFSSLELQPVAVQLMKQNILK